MQYIWSLDLVVTKLWEQIHINKNFWKNLQIQIKMTNSTLALLWYYRTSSEKEKEDGG